MKIAFLLYPTAGVKVNEDTSFWVMHELVRRGHRVTYFESNRLFWADGSPHAFLREARLHPRHGYLPSSEARRPISLRELDCIFIRKEPPFDGEYLHALQLLESVKRDVFVLNDPQGIALCNEKLFTLAFSRHIPETLVTENTDLAAAFVRGLKGRGVLKPLDDKAGKGVLLVSSGDKNLPSLLDLATASGKRKVLLQRFAKGGENGDKRLLVLGGRILGCFARKPRRGDFRANLSAGGSMHRSAVTAGDKRLVEAMAPELLRNGLYFAGLDVIGDALIEVNVTSPSGIPEVRQLEKKALEKDVADFIEGKVRGF